MSSLQGKAKGVMECWHTKAVRLPAGREAALSRLVRPRGREGAPPRGARVAGPPREPQAQPGSEGLGWEQTRALTTPEGDSSRPTRTAPAAHHRPVCAVRLSR